MDPDRGPSTRRESLADTERRSLGRQDDPADRMPGSGSPWGHATPSHDFRSHFIASTTDAYPAMHYDSAGVDPVASSKPAEARAQDAGRGAAPAGVEESDRPGPGHRRGRPGCSRRRNRETGGPADAVACPSMPSRCASLAARRCHVTSAPWHLDGRRRWEWKPGSARRKVAPALHDLADRLRRSRVRGRSRACPRPGR